MGFWDAVFSLFDTKVDSKPKENMIRINNADSVIKSAITFESSFVGTSAKDANARINKLLKDLNAGEKLIKNVFNKNLHSVDSEALDAFSKGCTIIKNDGSLMTTEFDRLHNVSTAVVEAINIILNSNDVDANSIKKLTEIKNSELAVLQLSHTVKIKFDDLSYRAENIARSIDKELNDDKDWENVKTKSLEFLKDIEECEKTVSKMIPVLKTSFTLLQDAIKLDEKIREKIQKQMNILISGSAEGTESKHSNESYNTTDRRNDLNAYALDLERQDKSKKKLKVA